jgi:hypothetical protein
MSEPATKQRQMIDLDEFERRLSRSPSPARNDDPLAELARLVGGGEDRFESMFQARPTRGTAPKPQQSEEPHHVPEWLVEESHRHAQPKGRTVDFAAIEAGLRGSLAPEFQNFADDEDRRWHHAQDRHQQQDRYAHDDYSHDDYAHDPHAHDQHVQEDYAAEEADWLDAPVAPHAAPLADEPRSRMPLFATAAIIVAGMLGIGATFAMKRTPAAPAQIALITAPTTPMKVAVADGGADPNASDNASILDKTPQQAPTAAVSQTEQPVDVNAVGKPAPAAQVAANAPAAAVPVPPPPGADTSQDVTLGDMVQPHKVKTISVRPDGSFADGGAPASPSLGAAPAADPAMPSMASNAGGASLAPAPAPAAAPAPQEPSRVPPASDDLPWSAQTGQNAAPTPAAPHSHKPVQVARVETGADDAATAPASGGGNFSVQLAAPGSEAEAHSALVRLTRSYGAELHGYHLKFRQAKVGAKTVYRVRVGGLSHAAAVSLCERLKAKGAACFLAHG